MKDCEFCGERFVPRGRQKYCGEVCARKVRYIQNRDNVAAKKGNVVPSAFNLDGSWRLSLRSIKQLLGRDDIAFFDEVPREETLRAFEEFILRGGQVAFGAADQLTGTEE